MKSKTINIPIVPADGLVYAQDQNLSDGHPSPTKKPTEKDRREANKRQKRLLRLTAQAILQYGLIEAHDKVMVCVSGGKDSLSMLHLLQILQKRAPVPFELVAMNVDQGQPNFPKEVLPRHFEQSGIPFVIPTQDTYSVVKRLIPEGKTMCSLCSRMRRGIIYRVASEIGATKIALGHHRDDVLATYFLNLFFAGKMKTMPPKLRSDDGKHTVIRPLILCEEEDLERFANDNRFPIIPCSLCGSQPNLQRQQMKEMINGWKKTQTGRVENIFRAMQNLHPAFMLDNNLYDFKTMTARQQVESAPSSGIHDEELFG